VSLPEDWRRKLQKIAESQHLELGEDVFSLMETFARKLEGSDPEPAVPAEQPTPVSPELLQAAVSDTFTPADLTRSGEDVAAVLRCSNLITLDGERRLRLDPQVRADVLRRTRNSPELLAALGATKATAAERANWSVAQRQSYWLQAFLSGDYSPAELDSLDELRVATQARATLAQVELPTSVPALATLQKQLALDELLEPLRVLIGCRSTRHVSAGDRFVGRDAEQRKLRTHVDELRSRSLGEGVYRGLQAVGRYIASGTPGVLMLEARGGLGKSSLMAKFVLDHTGPNQQPFPFAYLDFDRASLQPRPAMLLAEVVRQIGLQFPAFDRAVSELRSGELNFGTVRALMDKHVFSSGAHSFLLVLDTLEIVQRDQRSVQGLLEFVNGLTGEGFEQLRVVAAGRVAFNELIAATSARRSGELLELQPLDWSEAKAMANLLGSDLLGKAWRTAWEARIAGKEQDPPARREPLVIRVAVELMKAADSARREQLSLDIEELGEAADGSFAGALYQRRVLEHVGDVYASRLAWPGLVLRSISRQLVYEFLGPLCGLAPAHMDRAFDALAKEVWIVDSYGDVLRHRADLRARTLAQMKNYDPARFKSVNDAAVQYFADRPSDRTEWIYHRLLGGESLTTVNPDWDENAASTLKGAWEDFTVIAPAVAKYLRARTETVLLDAATLTSLGRGLALDHIARAYPILGGFDDVRIESGLLSVVRSGDATAPWSVDGKAVASVIAVKTGNWDAYEYTAPSSSTAWQTLSAFAFKFRRARTLDVENAQDAADELTDEHSRSSPLPRGIDSSLAAQDFAAARILRLPISEEIENALAHDPLLVTSMPLDVEIAARRVAGAFSLRSTSQLAKAWIEARRRQQAQTRTLSRAEILTLADMRLQGMPPIFDILKKAGLGSRLLQDLASRRREDKPLRISDERVVSAVEEHVLSLTSINTPAAARALKSLMAARNEDWIVPLGYAAAACLPEQQAVLPEPVLALLKSYDAPLGAAHDPIDALLALRFADEAGHLMAMVDAFLKSTPKSAARERLHRLAGLCQAWIMARLALIDPDMDVHSPLLPERAAAGPPLPPPAGPVPDDPQKGRRGGLSQHNGRELTAEIVATHRRFVVLNFTVRSTDSTELASPVVFHLHDSYPKSIIHIRKIRDLQHAMLEEVTANGVYTIGAQVRDANGDWIGLELDLATLKGLPLAVLRR
jgi:hypothetical protein